MMVCALGVCSPPSFALEPWVEQALLREDWPRVFETLQGDNTQAEDPVARLLMAHASLATNRNNAAMALFLSVKEPGDLTAWSTWTEALLRKQPQHPVALYLAADAKARIGHLQEAITGFSQAVQGQPYFALARNARGVAYVLNNQWDEAQVDFYLTTKLAPTFADAHANLGTLSVLREVSPQQGDAALAAFEAALAINPDFALAYNGRGCLYFGSGDFERAAEDFRQAAERSPSLVVADINHGLAAAYAAQLLTLASIDVRPGTTLESRMEQQHVSLHSQQQAMASNAPDQEFLQQIEALPYMSPEGQQAMIKKYGQARVEQAIRLKMAMLQSEIVQLNQEVQGLQQQIGAGARWSFRLALAQTLISLGAAAGKTRKDMGDVSQTGWSLFFWKSGAQVGRATVASQPPNPTGKVLLDAAQPSPVQSALNSSLHIAQAVVQDRLGAAETRQAMLTDQVSHWSLANFVNGPNGTQEDIRVR
jgi:tetratricopeptide (TPR) repeat protein